MALTAKLTSRFARKIREKGEQYYRRHRVTITEGGNDRVRGMVRGTEDYRTTIQLRDVRLYAWCSCPYIQQYHEPCKHLWALLRTAEQRGHLAAANRLLRLRLRIDEGLGGGGRMRTRPRPARPNGHHGNGAAPAPRIYRPEPVAEPLPAPGWRRQVFELEQRLQTADLLAPQTTDEERRLLYVVDLPASQARRSIAIDVMHQSRRRGADWGRPLAERFVRGHLSYLPDADDRAILSQLLGMDRDEQTGAAGHTGGASRFFLAGAEAQQLLAQVGRTGRLRLRADETQAELHDLTWDDGAPWVLTLQVRRGDSGKNYVLAGALKRGAETRPLSRPLTLPAGGPVLWEDCLAQLDDRDCFVWAEQLRREGGMLVPTEQADDLVQRLLELPRLPPLELPEELHCEEVTLPPRPVLTVRPAPTHDGSRPRLDAELAFEYDGLAIGAFVKRAGILQTEPRRILRRDRPAERTAQDRLAELGFRLAPFTEPPTFELSPKRLPGIVRTLIGEGWHVEAGGKVYHAAGEFRMEVSSGIDWFDLKGGVDFGGHFVPLPRILQALRRGESTVTLDDGTVGLLPEDWLKKYGLLAGLGTAEGESMRFGRAQVGLLDALLASRPDVTTDAAFRKARDELRAFEGVEAAAAPSSFEGTLRGYQREGLGWLLFLERFGFGGCLADDMGLGKTVQVLALLAGRAERRGKGAPETSLIVVPKSLVFNWKQEAARFAPGLRVRDHVGASRARSVKQLQGADLVLTTYGTLRRDALMFKDLTFDYCILDEAQAIKNPGSESAKAARLLKARHRLALSGTPVENHLGELWSLFEFLNPGMLGRASVFRMAGGAARNPDPETRTLLAKALRPYLLRRTKDQVAKDLPAKTEQTLYCDLEPSQRRLYDELRAHYRQALLGRIAEVGIKRAKVQVLEALLRLRQAACHPGLINKDRGADGSAKLDLLLSHVLEVTDEGHKSLVFSQFTSFLALVKERLDAEGIRYEYLDGRTRDRAARVERFQTDPDCPVFLISLKAGGVGLNLTAAEYVFLLDPWWNPAVEAQAIDRSHRIGQQRSVFAYRLIARNTVEEKVLELQKTKRDLADAIIGADNSLITDLQAEDLELLLS